MQPHEQDKILDRIFELERLVSKGDSTYVDEVELSELRIKYKTAQYRRAVVPRALTLIQGGKK